jgi:hypothetical protein
VLAVVIPAVGLPVALVLFGQQPANRPFCQQAQICDAGLLNFSPMLVNFDAASGWGKHERRSRSVNDAVACLNRATRHLPPVSARWHVVKRGTLGQKMRPAWRSRPTRASEWPWAITGSEPSVARHVQGCGHWIVKSSPPEGRMFRPLAFSPRTLGGRKKRVV